MMSYTPIWVSWPVKQISQLGNCRIFNNFHFSKRRAKPWRREVHLSKKKKFQKYAGTWLLFLKSEKGHIEVIPHHHTIMGTKEEVQGRRGRSVDVGGGDLGGGRVRGRVGAICFKISPVTCLFWVFPSQLPNKGKNAQIQKRDQRWNTWPHFNTSWMRPQGRWT